jgi:hypothetical protein
MDERKGERLMGKGMVLVGAIALGLVMANGASADEGEIEGSGQWVVTVSPKAARAPELTAYANDPARGHGVCKQLEPQYPGVPCHVRPLADSPNGAPWWLGNDATSWSVG